MSSRRTNDIETLSEQLGSLQITEEASNKDERTDTEMLTAPAPVVNKNGQVLWQPLITMTNDSTSE